ncbi:MAG: carboxypeptidase regulatory-like domain-containing protein [Bryobacteraceae bacterium]
MLLPALAMAQQAPPASQPAPATDPKSLAAIEGATFGLNHQPLPKTTLTLRPLPAPMPANPASGQPPPPPQTPYEATSDTDGKFSFQGIEPGRYTLTVSHAGYATTIDSAPGGGAANVLTLTAGQHMTDVAIELAPQAVLSGQVTDEDGDPTPGVTVRPMRPMLLNGRVRIATAGAGVQTGADGKYRLTVATGRWYLSFSIAPPAAPARARRAAAPPGTPDEPERDYVTTYYPGVTELTSAQGIDAAAGQQLPGLDTRLRKTLVYHVRGKIAGNLPPDPSGRTALRIFTSQETGDSNAGTFDEGQPARPDGTFDIAGLTPGAWTLTVVRQAGRRESLGRQPVEIDNQNVEEVVIAVQPPRDLSGSVRTVPQDPPGFNPSPQTITPLQVRLIPLDALLNSAVAPVQSDGAFTLKNVEAGKYRVDFFPPPGAFVKSVNFAGQEAIDSGIELTNGAGSTALRIVVSMTAGQIVGSVTDLDEGPPSVSYVTIVPEGPPPSPSALYRPELHRTVQTDPSGQFAVNSVVPGTYRVYAWERLDAMAFADPEFLKLFDSLRVVVTVTEDDSEQASLTRISAAKMDDEARKHGR